MFSGWNIFELIYLAVIIILPVVAALIFKSSIFELLSTLAALIAALLVAKGKPAAYPVSVVSALLYAFVTFQTRLYGETAIALCILFPIAVYGVFSWFNNKRDTHLKGRVIIVNKIKAAEYIILICSQVIAAYFYYWLLKRFGTQFPLFSVFTVATGIISSYLLARRSRFGLIAYILNDIMLICLWTSVVAAGSVNSIVMLLTPVLLLISDVYGAFNWKKFEKEPE